MSRRTYSLKLQELEPLVIKALEEQPGPVTLQALRVRVVEEAKKTGVDSDVVRATIMRLWEAKKLKMSTDREIELA